MLLEAYKKDADETLKSQEEQVYICKQDLESEKKKQSYIIPGVALVLGIVAGFFIAK